MNCCVLPTAIEAFAGVTAIDTSTGAVTVSVVEPVILPIVALMLEVPAVTPVAKPPAAIVATLGADELHVTKGVRFCVLPFLKWPVAVNCCVFPVAIEGFAGVTVIEVRPVSLPVPLSATRLGLPKALSLIVSVPCRRPTAVGVNVTPMVHLSPAPMPAPQVSLATAKSPLVAIDEKSNSVLR